MKKILMHACCAPCLIAPYTRLLSNDLVIDVLWYNPNIQPYQEYDARAVEVIKFCQNEGIKLIFKDDYLLEKFLQTACYREQQRCAACYYERLRYTASLAKHGAYDGFSTTLLYSKFQNHDMIKEIASSLAVEYKQEFFYHDMREFWKEGIQLSKNYPMYRQQYCGCIYSERDRYEKQLQRERADRLNDIQTK